MSQTSFFMSLALFGGSWVIWALIASSVMAVAVARDRWKLLKAEREAFDALRPGALAALEDGDLAAAAKAAQQHPGAAARMLSAALTHAPRGPEAAADHLVVIGIEERLRLEGRLLWLGTLGNNAPFVGLFGTVLGVIKAFHDLAESGAGPEVVMSGLSEALVATAVGLLVALPCVIAFNLLQKASRDLLAQADALGRRAVSAARERRR